MENYEEGNVSYCYSNYPEYMVPCLYCNANFNQNISACIQGYTSEKSKEEICRKFLENDKYACEMAYNKGHVEPK